MPWSGYPETTVSHLTFTEWTFALAAKREVQIGYAVRVAGGWELFGNGQWVWFTGAVVGFNGAVQIVAQWPEVQPMGPRNRVWQWVHWRNVSNVDAVVTPYFLLAPPLTGGWLAQTEQTTARKSLWTLVDIASGNVVAIGAEGASGGGAGSGAEPGGGGGQPGGDGEPGGLEQSVALRPLEGQRLRRAALEGDLQYVPVSELWKRGDQLFDSARATAPVRRPASRRRPARPRR